MTMQKNIVGQQIRSIRKARLMSQEQLSEMIGIDPKSIGRIEKGDYHPAPYIADYLDFNEYLVSHPSATIAVYAKGDSMILAGIDDGDMLVVNRALEANHRSIALVELNNEFTVKRIIRTELGIELHPENPQYPVIKPNDGETLNLVGAVTYIIKKAR